METAQRNEALDFHKKAKGKIQIYPTVNIRSASQLSIAYIDGSTPVCEEIKANRDSIYDYTGKGNRIAEITNGSSLLGIGNTGPEAAVPIIEGECLLLKLMGDINAVPMALNAPNYEDIISFCEMIAPTVGGINIEDVSSPSAFYILRELSGKLGIPVFCNDQHGTAVVVLAAVKNALRLLDISLGEARIVVMGAGSAGIASADLLLDAGAKDLIVLNASGIIGPSNSGMDPIQEEMAARTNPRGVTGGLSEAVEGADVLIGLSRGGVITQAHIKKMNRKPVILALALPRPEISCEDAKAAGAYVYASGRFEDDNTVLNIFAFPGIVRGALDVRASEVTKPMLLAAANALANLVDRRYISPEHFTPKLLGSESTPRVAEAVGQAAISEGVAALTLPEGAIYESIWRRLFGARGGL